MTTVSVCFTNFGPYHLARLRALASRLASRGDRLIAYEVAGTERTYPWRRSRCDEPFEWITLFPDRADRFKLSTAVRTSASFPFFSPATTLPTLPRRRVVDAGYYDTYGVSLAASWLFSVRNAAIFQVRTRQRYLQSGLPGLLTDARQGHSGQPIRISPPAAQPNHSTGLPGTHRQRVAYHPLVQR